MERGNYMIDNQRLNGTRPCSVPLRERVRLARRVWRPAEHIFPECAARNAPHGNRVRLRRASER
jgi:hypothetical protein